MSQTETNNPLSLSPAAQLLPQRYLSAQEVLDRYGVRRRTLDRWVATRGFPRAAIGGRGSRPMWDVRAVLDWEEQIYKDSLNI